MSTIVAFDLDDTLYKEIDFVKSGRRAVADAVAAETGLDADRLNRIMNESENAFDSLIDTLTAHGINSFDIARILEIYRSHHPDISLDKETEITLRLLNERDLDIALITDGRALTQRNKIEALGLYSFFSNERIYISGETGADKHTPLAYMNVANCACAPRRLFYIGDNMAKDFVNANLAGWTTIMLRDSKGLNIHPQNIADTPPLYRPKTIIDSLTQVLSIVH